MKYFMVIMVLLALCVPALAEDFEVTASQYVVVGGSITDTLGRVNLTPDSIRITVADSAGTELFDAWFNNADGQCTLNGDVITFHDQWNDINGASAASDIGIFHIVAVVASVHNTTKVYSNYNYTLRGLTTATEATQDVNVASVSSNAINIDLDFTGDWEPAQFNGPSAFWPDSTAIYGAVEQLIADSLAMMVDAVWDEVLTGGTHNVQNSAGKRLRAVDSDVISNGTGRGAPDGITFLLASAESKADDFYNGHILKIITGTGISQERTIEDYTGATDSVTLHTGDDWTTDPINNDEYEIIGGHAVEVNHIHEMAINSIAAYPPYLWKMVVNGSPTTIAFTVASIVDPKGNSPRTGANDFCLGQLIRGIDDDGTYGNSNSKVVSIADFVLADSTFTIRPGLASAFTVGDTVFILPDRGAVEPSVWTQFEIALTGGGHAGVDFSNINGTLDASEIGTDAITAAKIAINAIGSDEMAASAWAEMKNFVWANIDTSTFPTDSSDFVQYLARFFTDALWGADTSDHNVAASYGVLVKDTSAYQGSASGLTVEEIAHGVWGHEADSAWAASSFGDSAKGWGGGGGGGLSVEEGAQLDSLITFIVDSVYASVGFQALTDSPPTRYGTVHEKFGKFFGTGTHDLEQVIGDYSGAAGDNIEDDFDTLFARPSGNDVNLCSLYVFNVSGALTLGSVSMTQGATRRTASIDGAGWASFGLNNGTWTGLAAVTGNRQDTIPQTFSLSGDLTDSISMTAFTINTPTDTGKVNLYLYTDRIMGDTLEGAIMTVSPIKRGKNWKTDGGRVLLLGDITATANSDGLVQIEVYQSSFVHPYKWSRALGAYTTQADSLEYKITVSYGELAPFVVNFFVAPDSGDTYQIGGE